MSDYDLDKLGWVEFEPLIQTLLKSQLGLGVEAWGGTSDEGRDAYFEGRLSYPSKNLSTGPFVFQAKFIRGANASGAKSFPAVKRAVNAEVAKIKARGKKFVLPKHYSLLTNAPLSASARGQLKPLLIPVLPNCAIHFHDGRDICRWLDLVPDLASRFPQLFTIADLMTLLRKAANQGLLARSEVAVQMAKESSKVFVPTEPFFEAKRRLRRFSFCILEGPPEMGKTTIGRMIALSQIVLKWEAIECKKPKEFHDAFETKKRQVFIADDFFGRTEYDPRRVSAWQEELPYILRRLDHRHWLILTTRAHLLQIGRQSLDVTGENDRFPKLGEVIVNAADLNAREKARILFRHAKSAVLQRPVKEALKRSAMDIIGNKHFTPERIRRLVTELASIT